MQEDVAILPVHDSFIIRRSLQPWLIKAMSDAFAKFYDVPIDIRDGAKFLAMDFPTSDEIVVEEIVNHMSDFAGWRARNPVLP